MFNTDRHILCYANATCPDNAINIVSDIACLLMCNLYFVSWKSSSQKRLILLVWSILTCIFNNNSNLLVSKYICRNNR